MSARQQQQQSPQGQQPNGQEQDSMSQSVEPTISEDRTRGSKFDKSGDLWAALRSSTPPEAGIDFSRTTITTDLGGGPTYTMTGDDLATLQISSDFHKRETPMHQRTYKYQVPKTDFQVRNRPVGLDMRPTEASTEPSGPRAHADTQQPSPDRVLNSQIVEHGESYGHLAASLSQIANQLGIPEDSASSLDAMQSYISVLKSHAHMPPERPKASRPLTIHRVFEDSQESHRTYLDSPHWIEGGTSSTIILMGASPISNVQAYLTKHPEVCFFICRDYAGASHPTDNEETDANGNLMVKHISESIVPVEGHLVSATRKFAIFSASTDSSDTLTDDERDTGSSTWEFSNDWLEDDTITLSYPYLPFYHARGGSMDAFAKTLSVNELRQFQRVTDYILGEYEAEYSTVDDLVARSKIRNALLHYLFRPGIVVVEGRGAEARGYTCTSWLKPSKEPNTSTNSLSKTHAAGSLEIDAWHWDFNSHFLKTKVRLKIENKNTHDQQEKNIYGLSLRPLEHVDYETRKRLRIRGEWVWKCRQPRIIAYRDAT
ncbi:AAA family ATPase [Colletotrichum tabaci]|uniref:AAA family ATPase n=1 Tax=Colletotrichum tabaci TaxID=1209068 RepID=A0AAV9SYB9_9PEZI